MRSDAPKVLHQVGGLPLLAYPIRLAQALKVDKTVIIVGHQAELVQDWVKASHPESCDFALQAEQNGTGHAIQIGMKALKTFDGLVLVLSGDVPLLQAASLKKLVQQAKKPNCAGALLSMNPTDPTGYGRIIRNAKGTVTQIVEHKDCTAEQRDIGEVNAGIYCFSSAFLKKSLKKLSTNNAQGEYYLTDLIELASKQDQAMRAIVVSDPMEVLGANNRAQLALLEAHAKRRINEKLMTAGVTMIDPSTTYIQTDVKIGRDTIIQPGVHLRGDTKIGKECVIDTGTVITDSKIADRVLIKAHSMLEEAEVQSDAQIGPFARLRPGARIMKKARVGNFVEIKKTTLGKGAKASHLSYLGDSEIGAGANIGAGTITCNYDGFGKNKTIIGEGVFVGSNATLVAPLVLEKGVYVAAGSTVTQDAEADSLVLGRSRQVNKEGRAVLIREHANALAKAAKSKKQGGK